MAGRIRDFDWEQHAMGPIDSWSETLVTTLNMMLAAPVPMQLFWGPEFYTLYNDELLPILTDKHPRALGAPAESLWAEAWSTIGPQIHAVFETRQPVRFPAALVPINRNGVYEDAYWDYSYSAIPGEDGQIAGVIDIVRDATEAVQAEKAKREADERFDLAMEGAGLGIWFYNPETGAVAADERMHRIFGAEKLSGPVGYWLSMLHPDDRQRVGQHFSEAIEGKQPYEIEYRILRADGIRWVRSKGRLIHEGSNPGRLACIIEDITDRKLMAGALQVTEQNLRDSQGAAMRSQEQLQTITDALPTLIAYITPELRYARVNRSYEAWFGLTAAEIIGKHVVDLLGPEGAPRVIPQLREALAGKRQQFELKLTRHGQDQYLRITHIPDHDDSGRVAGVIVQSEDITERKHAEAILLRTEKLAAVGRLAASIAHEINNPLESVTNLLFLARNAQEPAQIHEYLDTAERELRRVSAISNQTLRFYRQSTRPRPVTCRELVESVLSMYQGRLVNSRIRVETDRCLEQTFECFEGEIRQVLSNLIGNAIDAMHPAGGHLFIRSRRATHWQTGRLGVAITIADTGSGMPPTVLQHLFEAFYTTKGIGGTGLGLWISKEIVDRHHGTLRVRSSQTEGRSGSVFTLFLPFEAVSR